MTLEPGPCLAAVGRWLGITWTGRQLEQYASFAAWLITEGGTIGGIGPQEADRIWSRHLCDSLVFGRDLATRTAVLDVGSGVGLPGIPLAIAFPDAQVTLVERSGRRCDALHRVSNILRLDVAVVGEDVRRVGGIFDRIVFRASLPLDQAIEHAARLMALQGADAWFGLGRGPHPEALLRWRSHPPSLRGLEIEEVEVPAGILDSSVWLLRMTRP